MAHGKRQFERPTQCTAESWYEYMRETELPQDMTQ